MKLAIFTFIILSLTKIYGQNIDFDYYQDVRGENIFNYSINPNLPDFKFILIGDSLYNTINEIIIFKNSEANPLQNIVIEEIIEPPIKETEYFTTGDFNFDGYKDIMLLEFWGATGNRIYQAWLFNPEKMQFEFNDFLKAIYSPEFDNIKQEFTTFSKGGGGEFSFSTYKFRKGKFILIKEEYQFWQKENNNFIYEIRERKNGKMKLISRKVIKE